jgi:hypothetical protein
MKLGIVVVYLLREGDERFLEIHLDYILKYTNCPYRIYGVPLRLSDKALHILESSKMVTLCDCEPTNERGGTENTHYLVQLIDHAIKDQCTHLALFHVDSFPIRPDWAQRMLGKMEQGFSLVAIRRDEDSDYKPHSSFMFFPASYYLDYHPKFRLTSEETNDVSYMAYWKEFPHIWDTGHGIGFNLYMNHLPWHPLLRSNRHEDHPTLVGIYEDTIFHFGTANIPSFYTRKQAFAYKIRKAILDIIITKIAVIRPGIEKHRSRLNPPFKKTKLYKKIVERNSEIRQGMKKNLFEDTDSYIDSLL